MLRKIAHNSTIPALAGNQDLRPLQALITAEKAVIISLQKLTADFSKASEALKTWGLGEGEDLGNILSASTTVITHFTSALSQYASHGHSMREQLKAIRTREEDLDELKRRRRNVMTKAESTDKKLQRMGPEHKNLGQQMNTLNQLREEIRGLDLEIMREEAAIGDFKRTTTRSWLGLKFGGLLELCEKGVIVGEYGKLVVSEIPEDETQPGLPRNPYFGHAKVEGYLAETHRCVNEVRLSTVPCSSAPQIRRPEQQSLPQVPTVSNLPSMTQANVSVSSPYSQQLQPSFEPYHDIDGPRRDVLPEHPGLGTGRLLDSPTDNTYMNPFSQTQHQPQYSGSLSSASAFQSQSGRHIGAADEFGSTSGPVDTTPSTGGRFATFPVKGRSGSVGAPDIGGGGYPQRVDAEHDTPFSLLSTPPQREQLDSFSSSVAQALAATSSSSPPHASRDAVGYSDNHDQEPLPPPGRPGRLSKDGPAPSYESSLVDYSSDNIRSSTNNATTPGRLGPNDNMQSQHSTQVSSMSDDEALLASTHLANEPGGGVNDKHISRHVRFDDANIPPITSQDSSFASSSEPATVGGDASGSQAGQEQSENQRGSFDERVDMRESRIYPRSTPPAATAPTGITNPEVDDRALNAAAAREIAFELQSASSSSTAHAPLHTIQPIPSTGPTRDISSPLVPPNAAYMAADRRSVSPRPPADTTILATPATAAAAGGDRAASPEPSSPGPAPSYTEEPVQISPPMQSRAPTTHLQHQESPLPPHSQHYGSRSLSRSPSPPSQSVFGAQQAAGYRSQQLPPESEFNPYDERQVYQSQASERGRGYSTNSQGSYASGAGVRKTASPPPPQIHTPPLHTTTNQKGTFALYGQQPQPPLPQLDSSGIETRGLGGAGVYDSPRVNYGTGSGTLPPLEPPNAPHLHPGGNRSSSSLTGSTSGGGGGGGGGKISAAAFKRPSPRPGPPGSGPNSPFAPTPFSSGGGGWMKSGLVEEKQLPSPFETDLAPPQHTQPLHVSKKRDTQELDAGQYDYINAYVNSGDGGHGGPTQGYDDAGAEGMYYAEQTQRATNANAGGGGWAGIGSGRSGAGAAQGVGQTGAGGYGQGRFSTNLDYEGLR